MANYQDKIHQNLWINIVKISTISLIISINRVCLILCRGKGRQEIFLPERLINQTNQLIREW